MPAGSPFSERQERDIAAAVRTASRDTGVNFSVFVGPCDGQPALYAERLHRALGADLARTSVLVMVAPDVRRVEIVTGSALRTRLRDRECGLAALSMTSSFTGGDLAGGIVEGVRMLAQHAGSPRSSITG